MDECPEQLELGNCCMICSFGPTVVTGMSSYPNAADPRRRVRFVFTLCGWCNQLHDNKDWEALGDRMEVGFFMRRRLRLTRDDRAYGVIKIKAMLEGVEYGQ